MASHIDGYPPHGPKRELKFALDGKSNGEDLQKVAKELRLSIWKQKQMADAGINSIPSNTFSYHDQVLDTTTRTVPLRMVEMMKRSGSTPTSPWQEEMRPFLMV